MAEYIERKALDKAMTASAGNDKDKNRRTWAKAICVLHDLPAADVAPVVHGRWMITEGRIENAVCSNCGRHFQSYYEEYHYCPNCGCRMGGGENAPSVDAESVIRCKYCGYWQDNNGGYPNEECRWGHGETPDANDFCSYGERKGGEAAIDADDAPVVHCRHCRSYNKPRLGWCSVHLDREGPDDFCSYGVRMDGDSDAAD